MEHGFLEEEVTDSYDQAGLPVIQKSFNLSALNQAALWIRAVTEQIQENTEDISAIKDEMADLKNQLKLANAEIKELKRQNSLSYAKEIVPERWDM